MDKAQPWPPDSHGVYVVSLRPWAGVPDKKAAVLYVGGNTSDTPLFAVRVGSFVADLMGFCTKTHGHHCGGESVYMYCRRRGIHPLGLYVGWLKRVPCPPCAELEVYHALGPKLNKVRPSACKKHKSVRPCLDSAQASTTGTHLRKKALARRGAR
jgi:hypothetical protein